MPGQTGVVLSLRDTARGLTRGIMDSHEQIKSGFMAVIDGTKAALVDERVDPALVLEGLADGFLAALNAFGALSDEEQQTTVTRFELVAALVNARHLSTALEQQRVSGAFEAFLPDLAEQLGGISNIGFIQLDVEDDDEQP
jgi:hypothetical protein